MNIYLRWTLGLLSVLGIGYASYGLYRFAGESSDHLVIVIAGTAVWIGLSLWMLYKRKISK